MVFRAFALLIILGRGFRFLGVVLGRVVLRILFGGGGILFANLGQRDGAAVTQKLVAAIGISRKGCPVGDRDDDPTHIFILSLCPKDATQPYLQFVAQVAGVLTNPDKVAEVLAASDANAVRDIFLVR